MVLAVICDPLRDRALHRHAAEDRERRLHGRMRAEAAVREVAVEADRRAERARHVERNEQNEVDRVEGDAPEEAHRREQPHGRDDHRHERHDLADVLDSGRTVPTGTLPGDALSNICPTSIGRE